MKQFRTTKLEERKLLEEKGFQCHEEIGEKSVVFIFEVEEDVIIDAILNPPQPPVKKGTKKAKKK